MTARSRFVAVVLLVLATAATQKNEVPVYTVGSIVKARCDGGDEMKWLSVYPSPRVVLDTYDNDKPFPMGSREVRAGTLLRVIATERHQTYTPVSHTPFLNLQVLEVQPVSGPRWRGYVDSMQVDPPHGLIDETNICE
jgi:hypothetical protein